jgi:hypothetical protein
MIRFALSLALGCLLLFGGSAIAADKPIKGSIVKIEKDKDVTTITVAIAKKKKDTSETPKEEKKFKLSSSTKIEKLTGKKDSITRADAKTDELKEGQQVSLTVSGDKVEKVEFNAGKKSK